MELATSSRRKMEWGDEQEKLLKFMIHGQSESQEDDRTTLDLLGGGSCSSSSSITSDPGSRSLDQVLDVELPPPPSGWEKRLDLKNGKLYYVHLSSGTSSYHHPVNPQTSNLLRELEHMTTKRRLLGSDDLELRLGTSSRNLNGLLNIQAVKELEASSKWKLQQMPGQGKLERPVSSSCDYSNSCSSSESSSSSDGKGNQVLLTGCKRCFMTDLVKPTCPKCSNRLHLQVRQVKKPRTDSCTRRFL